MFVCTNHNNIQPYVFELSLLYDLEKDLETMNTVAKCRTSTKDS